VQLPGCLLIVETETWLCILALTVLWLSPSVRMALRGVQAVHRGAVLEVLSRAIWLYDYYCIVIGAKQLSVLMLKEGPWEGCCLG
jgi:hypothetical protein